MHKHSLFINILEESFEIQTKMFHFCLYSAHIAYSIPSVLLCEKGRKYMEGIADAVVNEAKPSVCVCVFKPTSFTRVVSV